MARAVSEIEQEIRALPDAEKERLLRALLEELDGPPDAGAEQAWLDEIQRRSRELEAGLVETIPADKVFADLRAKLARGMNLRFLPAAREELDAAASYLEDRVAGLGGEFLDDVERTSTLLCQFSQIGRRLDSIHREVPLQRFSFNLVYRNFGGEAVVVAVAHKRRRPGYWRGRT